MDQIHPVMTRGKLLGCKKFNFLFGHFPASFLNSCFLFEVHLISLNKLCIVRMKGNRKEGEGGIQHFFLPLIGKAQNQGLEF